MTLTDGAEPTALFMKDSMIFYRSHENELKLPVSPKVADDGSGLCAGLRCHR